MRLPACQAGRPAAWLDACLLPTCLLAGCLPGWLVREAAMALTWDMPSASTPWREAGSKQYRGSPSADPAPALSAVPAASFRLWLPPPSAAAAAAAPRAAHVLLLLLMLPAPLPLLPPPPPPLS